MKDLPQKEITLKSLNCVVQLYDRMDPEKFCDHDAARNVYLVNEKDEIVWQVKSDYDNEGNPFTNIILSDEDYIIGYRWDGGLYKIDLENGYAYPIEFVK